VICATVGQEDVGMDSL